MYRKIELNYKLNEDKTLLTINYLEENATGFTNIIKEYNLIKVDESTDLYNIILDDLDAEYDDELAELINKLLEKIMKN